METSAGSQAVIDLHTICPASGPDANDHHAEALNMFVPLSGKTRRLWGRIFDGDYLAQRLIGEYAAVRSGEQRQLLFRTSLAAAAPSSDLMLYVTIEASLNSRGQATRRVVRWFDEFKTMNREWGILRYNLWRSVGKPTAILSLPQG